MDQYIIILGEINDTDRHLLEKSASAKNIKVTHYLELPPVGFFTGDNLPLAFISCFPSEKSSLLQLFGDLPIGTGERIPLFQKVSPGEIESFLINLPIQGFFELPLTMAVAGTIIQITLRNEELIRQNQKLTFEIEKCRNQKNQLAKIGISLTKENDIGNLLKIILSVCREMVDADAGSIYVRERIKPGGAYSSYLTFKVTQNDSVDVGSFNEFHLPIDDNSIAGYVAKTAHTLNISDIDHLDKCLPCHFDRGWEKKIGYRTISMLTLPLKNIESEVVGVLQLINKKRDKAVQSGQEEPGDGLCAFTLSDEMYVQSIASQAALSIERAHYHECIKALFEGFLGSSIAAIDERDKVTSGHSKRVMGYATAFVEAVKNDPQCRFAQLVISNDRIRQFQYAALLHDIGKIGVPESLLTKETKLDPGEWANLHMRFRYICLQMNQNPDSVDWDSVECLENDLDFLEKVNKSGFCNDEMYDRLLVLKNKKWNLNGEKSRPLFTDTEWEKLSVRKGNLTDEERISINSHAISTHRILTKIPWTKNLEQIPLIAAQHHEKLNGSGYPGGLNSKEIILESKILAVIDIFEALVSQDRPYKPKMDVEKALEILIGDANRGLLDSEIVDFFIEKKIYETYMLGGQAAMH